MHKKSAEETNTHMTVYEFINDVAKDKLTLVYEGDLTRKINMPGVNKGSVHFLNLEEIGERIVILGRLEMSIIDNYPDEVIEKMFERSPAVIITKNQEISKRLLQIAQKVNTTIFKTSMSGSLISGFVYFEVAKRINPATSWHGVLMRIFGVGVIIQGESGIGKSEIAIELISRGHQLISDDRIIIREIYPGQLLGICPSLTHSLLELRGVGVVSISDLYGVQTVGYESEISLIIQLDPFKEGKEYYRLIGEEITEKIFETSIPKKVIPVSTGRNMSAIIEAAVNNHILKSRSIKTGFDILIERINHEKK